MVRLAVDAMGGDHAPQAILDGCLKALEEYPDLSLVLCGDESAIRSHLQDKSFEQKRVRIMHTTEVVTNEESPVQAIKQKKNSSLVVGLTLAADEEVDGFVTAGSTGATLAGGTLIVRRIRGVLRPALAPVMPNKRGTGTLLIDCGANVDCKPQYLAQFGLMGSAYMEKVMGVENPRVGLLNNGAEEGKGNELAKESFPLLKEMPINFVGNMEGRDIFTGDYDVAVADGFVGNTALKVAEGVGSMLFSMIKEEIMASFRTKVGAVLLKPALSEISKRTDYTEYGGALLLGLNAPVVKAHGSSNANAFFNALRQALDMVKRNVVPTIREAMEEKKGIES
ncbi:phosphate acyltransferase PlsX [Eubacteriales bacterium OttesenSCG-928-M02]|nr:phosphate acyltransferase PlsX [Eubacteriales bacterium OttesenSCG-928-M02]